jgi:hypothetical protein
VSRSRVRMGMLKSSTRVQERSLRIVGKSEVLIHIVD